MPEVTSFGSPDRHAFVHLPHTCWRQTSRKNPREGWCWSRAMGTHRPAGHCMWPFPAVASVCVHRQNSVNTVTRLPGDKHDRAPLLLAAARGCPQTSSLRCSGIIRRPCTTAKSILLTASGVCPVGPVQSKARSQHLARQKWKPQEHLPTESIVKIALGFAV